MALSEKLRKKMEQKKKELASRGGGMKGLVSFKEGKTRIRFLNCGDEDFAFEATQFYLGKEIGGFISPATFGEPCAVNEFYTKLSKSTNDDDREIAETLKPRKKPLAPIIKYKDEKGKEIDEDKGAALAILTNDNYQELVDWMLDEDDYGDFTDPKNGYDIKINRVGAGKFDTKYKLMKCDSSKLAKKYAGTTYSPEDMVRKLIPSYEDTQEFLLKFQLANGLDTEEPKKKKKKAAVEEEPVKKKKKKVKK
jgi:hypothetical protein